MKKLTKEEIGYKPTDKMYKMWLLNPHDHHFLYIRDDGSFYGFTHMKGEDPEEWFGNAELIDDLIGENDKFFELIKIK